MSVEKPREVVADFAPLANALGEPLFAASGFGDIIAPPVHVRAARLSTELAVAE
jgi:hypothetical protein